MYLFELYHQHTKSRPKPRLHPRDWPEEWTTTHTKVYERFSRHALPQPRMHDAPLTRSILGRESSRLYTQTLTEEALSDILYYGCGEKDPAARHGQGSRVYASAGARYPLEVYVCLFVPVGSLCAGVYHYAVDTHRLERIGPCSAADVARVFQYPESHTAQCAIVLTALFERSAVKYGERAYRHVHIECGEVTAHMHLVAGICGVGSVSMSGYIDDELESLLDIDGVNESVIHTVICG